MRQNNNEICVSVRISCVLTSLCCMIPQTRILVLQKFFKSSNHQFLTAQHFHYACRAVCFNFNTSHFICPFIQVIGISFRIRQSLLRFSCVIFLSSLVTSHNCLYVFFLFLAVARCPSYEWTVFRQQVKWILIKTACFFHLNVYSTQYLDNNCLY